MRVADKARLRIRSLFRRRSVDSELDAELRFHLDHLIEENLASGMAAGEARRAALRAIGGLTQLQEECRDMRGINMIEGAWRDLRQAMHVLYRRPGFTAIAALTLALGIGATTAIFSVVYGVLLKPLPFEEPERLVGLYHRGPGVNVPVMNQGPATYFTYIDNQRAFEAIGAWARDEVSITGRGEPERVKALAVTNGTLPLLGIRPILGRLFHAEDDKRGSPVCVILTYAYWQRRFGAHDVLGQSIEIDGELAEIVGVLPASFRFLRADPAVLLPLRLERARATGVSFGFQALARLKPGVDLSAANADVARMIPLVNRIPGYAALRLEPNVRPLSQDLIGNTARILWILLGTVGIVLLIACVNVANLFLVRAEGRQQELAIRAALGAGRGRIARELLAESLLLGLAGGVAGLLFALACISLLRRLAPATLPRLEEIGIDPAVLLFALAISLLTGLLFGCIPILKPGTPALAALKEGGRSASDAPAPQRTRNTLVIAEVAMALVLLILSGLMVRTFVAMQQVEPGFARAGEVQTFRIEVPETLAASAERMARLHEEIAQRLRQTPGVVSVGLASSITMDGEDNGNPLRMEHVDVPEGRIPPLRRFKSVAPGYFETMGNRLIAGRAITWTDIYQERRVVVISETLAREYWKNPADALGKRVRAYRPTWYEIVGVSGNERDDGLSRPPAAIVYWPLLNDVYLRRNMAYAVRSARVGAAGFLRELQQAVWSVNSTLPMANVLTLDEIQADSMAQTSFAMVMLAIAASVALLLGLAGIYGVIAYIAAQRTREIGIRIALGAQARDVRLLFLRHGLVLTGAGIAIGLLASLAVTRVLSAFLFGVGPVDPVTYAAVPVGLAAAALMAAWLPARHASRLDPIAALRADG
jgi:predicted permease